MKSGYNVEGGRQHGAAGAVEYLIERLLEELPQLRPQAASVPTDGPDFPDAFKPLSAAHGEALKLLRGRNDVRWTYISPAGDFQAEGARTGEYILGGEELVLNGRGESVISYADYAIAMVDEIVGGSHIQERISVVRK